MATAVKAVIDAGRDTQTPELPAVAEDLAHEVTLFGTYDQAEAAVNQWFAVGVDAVNLVLPPGRPADELADVLGATAAFASAIR